MAEQWLLFGTVAEAVRVQTTPELKAAAFVTALSTSMRAKLHRTPTGGATTTIVDVPIPGPVVASGTDVTLAVVNDPSGTVTTTNLTDGASYVFELTNTAGDGGARGSAGLSGKLVSISSSIATKVDIGPLTFRFGASAGGSGGTVPSSNRGAISGTTFSIALPTVGASDVTIIRAVFVGTGVTPPSVTTPAGFTKSRDQVLSAPAGGDAKASRFVEFTRAAGAVSATIQLSLASAATGAWEYHTFPNRKIVGSSYAENLTYTTAPVTPAVANEYANVVVLATVASNQFLRTITSSALTMAAPAPSTTPTLATGSITQAAASTVAGITFTLADPSGGAGGEQTHASVIVLADISAVPNPGGGGGGSTEGLGDGPGPLNGSYSTGSPSGGGWTTLLQATDPPVELGNYYGWHHQWGLTRRQLFKVARAHDISQTVSGADGYASLQWAKMERTKGVREWSKMQSWIDNTVDCTRVYTFWTSPTWASKRDLGVNIIGGGFVSANFSPPRDMQDVANFFTDMYSRFTVSQIPVIEIGNEPKFGDGPGFSQMGQDDFIGGRVLNPFTSNESDTTRSSGGGGNHFFTGTPRELARIAYTVRQSVPAGVKLIGCGWEQTVGSYPGEYTIRDFWAFMNADIPGGQKAADIIDWVSYHPYLYSNNPEVVHLQHLSYKYWMGQLATALGKPALASRPLAVTEVGHEVGGGGGAASSFTAAQIATTNKRATAILAALGARMCIWYIDRTGETVTTYPPSGANNATMIAACDASDVINNNRIRQAAWKPSTGECWLRFDNNTELTV